MNYRIIANEELLREFIGWLPELDQDETFYCCLFARKKYCDPNSVVTKNDKQQLKRFTTNKVGMIEKIHQLECELGSYTTKGEPISNDSLAMYVMPNPRSFQRAARNGVIELVKRVTEPYNGYNPHQLMLNAIQASPGKKKFVDFDFDFDGNTDESNMDDVITRIHCSINADACTIVRTRGGFHLLVETRQVNDRFKNSFYNEIMELGVDVRGDNLLPMVGCYQGGFVPYFIK